MGLINLKQVPDYRVKEWLMKSIRDLTPFQKEWIINDEIIRFAPFKFYERKKKVKNIYVRLSIIFIPIPFIVLFLGLPFNFIITGSWGYNRIDWFSDWLHACGIY